MLALFQRFHRELCLLLLVLLGLAGGQLAATLLGTGLRGPASPTRAATQRQVPQAAPETDLGYILQNNLFNAAARSATPVSFVLQAAGGGEAATVRGDLELLGTVVAGSRSQALLRIGQELKTFHLDEEIPGGRIEEIARHQVTIRNQNRSLTILEMYQEGAARPAGASRAAEGAAVGSATAGSSGTSPDRSQTAAAPGGGVVADAVRPAGTNRWVIARSAAEAARANIGEQLRTALIQPNLINGKTDGFVVRRIQPGTLLAQMGLLRGDVIKRVNSMPLDSPEKALQIMQQLREARQLSVDLERGGQPLSLAYEIE